MSPAGTWSTDWTQVLGLPSDSYLEAGEGPVPTRLVEWVQLVPVQIIGGMAGKPRRLVDITEDVLASLREIGRSWQMRDVSWTLRRIVEDEPVRVIHLENPFFGTPAPSVASPGAN